MLSDARPAARAFAPVVVAFLILVFAALTFAATAFFAGDQVAAAQFFHREWIRVCSDSGHSGANRTCACESTHKGCTHRDRQRLADNFLGHSFVLQFTHRYPGKNPGLSPPVLSESWRADACLHRFPHWSVKLIGVIPYRLVRYFGAFERRLLLKLGQQVLEMVSRNMKPLNHAGFSEFWREDRAQFRPPQSSFRLYRGQEARPRDDRPVAGDPHAGRFEQR